MKVIDAQQGSAAWLAARAGKVTASRIADVIARTKTGPSASRAGYMGELIAERLTGQVAEGYTNADMQRGIEVEPQARAAYEARTGLIVDAVGFVLHPRIDLAGASPDGLAGDGLFETKCPRTHTHIEYLLGRDPPSKYIPQMAWQCACTERPYCDFVSFDPRMPEELQLFIVRYVPSPEYLAELEAEVQKFLSELDTKIRRLKDISRPLGGMAVLAEIYRTAESNA